MHNVFLLALILDEVTASETHDTLNAQSPHGGHAVKHKPPDYRLIQVCFVLTRLTKGIRRECEMKDVFGSILRQLVINWEAHEEE